MKKIIKHYLFFIIAAIASIIIFILNAELGRRAFETTVYSLQEMLIVIPPIFVLLGLLDVWVPKETMVKFMGENSGIKGIILAIIAGSVAAGPLYGAFPVSAVFLKKGASLRNVFIFIGAWSTTKIPMFLFEYPGLGPRFAVTRLLVDIPGIIIIGFVLAACMKERDRKLINEKIMESTEK
ncbi:MAG: permease [Spirochaetales bacterium]|nr:permease [Spirochaetales bacterium]